MVSPLSFDRRGYLGSNETGIVTGVSGYKSKRLLFEEKRGLIEPFMGNDLTELGLHNEPLILDKYAESLGKGVKLVTQFAECEAENIAGAGYFRLANTTDRNIPEIYYNSLHGVDTACPWFRGTADGFVTTLDRTKINWGVDAKMVFDWQIAQTLKDGELPPKFRAQGEHFCELFRVMRWDFHCLLACDYGKYVTVTYSHPQDSWLQRGEFFAACDQFWRDIQNDNPPPFDGSEGSDTPRLIAARHGSDSKFQAEAGDEQVKLAFLAVEAKAERDKGEMGYRKTCGQLADSMGEVTKLVGEDGKRIVTRSKNGAMLFGPEFVASVEERMG